MKSSCVQVAWIMEKQTVFIWKCLLKTLNLKLQVYEGFCFQMLALFFWGGKLFCLFICKHLLHSCLMNGQYVLWFLQTKLESFNLLLHDYTFSTCTQSAADTYYGYIQIQNIWLATNYKLWHSLHKCIKHQFIQTTFYPYCYTHLPSSGTQTPYEGQSLFICFLWESGIFFFSSSKTCWIFYRIWSASD